MMISPEAYYVVYLKEKNEKQILSVIRGLKKEIGHLKNVMEQPDYGFQRSVEIEYCNGHKPVSFGGSNAYPYNFAELKELFGISTEYEGIKYDKEI